MNNDAWLFDWRFKQLLQKEANYISSISECAVCKPSVRGQQSTTISIFISMQTRPKIEQEKEENK